MRHVFMHVGRQSHSLGRNMAKLFATRKSEFGCVRQCRKRLTDQALIDLTSFEIAREICSTIDRFKSGPAQALGVAFAMSCQINKTLGDFCADIVRKWWGARASSALNLRNSIIKDFADRTNHGRFECVECSDLVVVHRVSHMPADSQT